MAGTQKAATTWLYECLREHPDVFVSRPKELHFFCPKGVCWKSRADQGMDWYLGQFPETGRSARGELSVDYMYYPEVAGQIAALNPAMRVLFILRNPIERAYSAYWMNRRGKSDMPAFAEFIRPDSDFVARGFYWRQIERFLAVLPREQIKVMVYEDIAANPQAFVSSVYEFIGVASAFTPPSLRQQVGETKALPPMISTLLYRQLTRLLHVPAILAVWRATKRTTGLKQVRSGSPTHAYPSLGPDERRRLESIYHDENERLFEFLGSRIPSWDE